MIVKEEFLNKLRRYFSLNLYEVKVWTALLSRGVSTAGELSDIANVPRSRSYDVLESLEKKGFIIMKLGKPIKYLAVHPEEVLKRVKQRIREDADVRTNLMEQLEKSEILDELLLLHNQGADLVEPGDMSGAFKGRTSLYDHLGMMIKNAKQSIHIHTTALGMQRKADALRTALARAAQRGVKVIVSAPLGKETQKAQAKFAEFAEVRDVQLAGRWCVVDEKEVLLMVLDDKKTPASYDVGVWLNAPYFVGSLNEMFKSQQKK